MSGICGFVGAGRADGAPGAAATMLRGLDVAGRGGGESVADGPAVLAALPGPGDPSVLGRCDVPGGSLLIAFQGTLFRGGAAGLEGPASAGLAGRLLEAWLERGAALLDVLRGDFALAVWDGRDRSLVLAVDPFRVHPVFYSRRGDDLVFGSRMAAVAASPLAGLLSIDPARLVEVIATSSIATPRTVYREVRKLPPGHVLRVSGRDERVSRWWDQDFRRKRREPRAALEAEVRRILRGSIEARVAVDGDPGEIGGFLSGGIDSSTVVGLLGAVTGRAPRSFSIGFGEERFNEIEYARISARHFRADHHEYFVTPADAFAAFDVLLRHFDEPFANSSAVPTYHCAKLALDHGVRTLYAGDSGDELFAGNPWYATQRLFDAWSRIPWALREPVLRPAIALAARAGLPLAGKAAKYVRRASIPYPQRMTSYGFFNTVPMHELFEPAFLEAVGDGYDPDEALYALYAQAPADDDLDRRLYIDLKLTIGDNDVLKVTRMCQAAGVTVRFPFLDREVAEFAASLPPTVKMKGRRLRSFFKGAYRDVLPPEVLTKKKHGFGLPIPVWLRTDPALNERMRDLVLGRPTLERGVFRRAALEELVRRHESDTTSFYGTALWHLMMVEAWLRSRPTAPRGD